MDEKKAPESPAEILEIETLDGLRKAGVECASIVPFGLSSFALIYEDTKDFDVIPMARVKRIRMRLK